MSIGWKETLFEYLYDTCSLGSKIPQPFPWDNSSCTSWAHPPVSIQLYLCFQHNIISSTGVHRKSKQRQALLLLHRSKQPQSSVIWSLTIIQSGLRNLCTHCSCVSIFAFHFKTERLREPSGFAQHVQGIIGSLGISGMDFHNMLFIHNHHNIHFLHHKRQVSAVQKRKKYLKICDTFL